jgi:hypothetical protein
MLILKFDIRSIAQFSEPNKIIHEEYDLTNKL